MQKTEIPETETHPHKPFAPENATVLILGSFPGVHNSHPESGTEWFYASKRNQFWNILRGVYQEELLTTEDKKKLFEKHGIAIADVLLKIRRKENNNLDSNLEIVEYNDKALSKLLAQHTFNAVYFTSKFVEKHFMKLFPHIKNGECLPSPSPRYARMSLTEKINYYKNKLPE
ncbi:MAG: uracil-DNA glycosylase family protein [Ginsengibacter sp.]